MPRRVRATHTRSRRRTSWNAWPNPTVKKDKKKCLSMSTTCQGCYAICLVMLIKCFRFVCNKICNNYSTTSRNFQNLCLPFLIFGTFCWSFFSLYFFDYLNTKRDFSNSIGRKDVFLDTSKVHSHIYMKECRCSTNLQIWKISPLIPIPDAPNSAYFRFIF